MFTGEFELCQGCKLLFKTFCKLLCSIFYHITKHHVRGFRFSIYHIADGTADQLFFKKHKKFDSLMIFAVIDQAAADFVSEMFPGIANAHQL